MNVRLNMKMLRFNMWLHNALGRFAVILDVINIICKCIMLVLKPVTVIAYLVLFVYGLYQVFFGFGLPNFGTMTEAPPADFYHGAVHGLFAGASFIVGLFTGDYAIFSTNYVGVEYHLGFGLGVYLMIANTGSDSDDSEKEELEAKVKRLEKALQQQNKNGFL